jgi:hypothetical protein
VAARIGHGLTEDAQHLSPTATKGPAGQVIVDVERHLAAGRHLAGHVNELAQGVAESALLVLFKAQVVDRGAKLMADLAQDRVDVIVAVGPLGARGGQRVRQALARPVMKIAGDAAALGIADVVESTLRGLPLLP